MDISLRCVYRDVCVRFSPHWAPHICGRFATFRHKIKLGKNIRLERSVDIGRHIFVVGFCLNEIIEHCSH